MHISWLFCGPQHISGKACLKKQTKNSNRETATENYWKALKIKQLLKQLSDLIAKLIKFVYTALICNNSISENFAW